MKRAKRLTFVIELSIVTSRNGSPKVILPLKQAICIQFAYKGLRQLQLPHPNIPKTDRLAWITMGLKLNRCCTMTLLVRCLAYVLCWTL